MNTKCIILVPSYSRAYEIEKRTLFWLKKLNNFNFKIVVRSEQSIYYRQVCDNKNLLAVNADSFIGQLNAMIQYAREKGYQYIAKVDDDMLFKTSKSNKENAHIVYEEALEEIIQEFETNPSLAAVSIAKPVKYLYNSKQEKWLYNKQIQGNYVIRISQFDNFTGIELGDDLYVSLVVNEILKLQTAQYLGCYEDAIGLKNKGGLQSFNRNQMTINTYEYLKKVFPNITLTKRKGYENNDDIDISFYVKR